MVFIWLAWKKIWSEVKWKYVFITIITGLIFCTPVLWWNAQNEWISFQFQLNHGLGKTVWKPKYTWRYFYGQLFLVFPTVLYFAFKARNLKKLSWLPIFSWFPLAFFFLTSFRGKVEANWPSITYPCIVVLALLGSGESLRWAKWTVRAWVVAALVVCSHIVWPWIPLDHKKLKTYELVAYKPLQKIAESYTPFYAPTFQLASKLWYETKKPMYKLKGMSRRDFYDELPGSEPKGPVYFFSGENWNRLPQWAKERGDRIVRKFPIDQKTTLFEVHTR